MTDANAQGFILENTQAVPGLDLVAQTWRHPSGLTHLHLACEDVERAFSIAFPTHPENETGVAHALEHLVLCGSADFPVRDPFFNMLRRSLATYANAQTAPDHTRYPFATTDAQDYWNLMDVYLDAVFFPTLDALDFEQEAVRLVAAQAGEPAGFDGVVFNEMVGARSAPMAFLPLVLAQAVAPGSPYARDFGGAPEHLPDLTIEALRLFHARHYQADGALLMTYGKVDPEQVQARLVERVLNRQTTPVAAAQRPDHAPSWPARVSAMLPQDEAGAGHHLWIKLWELPNATPGQSLRSGVMSGMLCEEGQRLAVALDNLGFGQRLASGTTRFGGTLALVVAVAELTHEQMALVETAVTEAIAEQFSQGVDEALVQTMLTSLEMSQRMITRDGGQGTGLQLMGDIATHWAWSGQTNLEAVDLDRALAEVEHELTPEGFLVFGTELASARSTVVEGLPDPTYFSRRRLALDTQAAARDSALTPEGRQTLLARAEALLARQQTIQDTSVLPILSLTQVATVPAPSAPIVWQPGGPAQAAIARIAVPMRGVVEMGAAFDLGALSEDQAPWLSLALELWPRMAIGDRDWEQTEQWRSLLPSQLSARLTSTPTLIPEGLMNLELGFSGAALVRQADALRDGLCEAVLDTRFDDVARLRFLVTQKLAGRERHLGRLGQSVAGKRAVAWLGPHKALTDRMEGADGLAFLAQVQASLATDEGASEVGEKLTQVLEWVRAQPVVLRGCESSPGEDGEWMAPAAGRFKQGWQQLQRQATAGPVARAAPAQTAFVGPTELSYVHQTLAGPSIGHPDEAAMAVAAELISSQFLHGALRERGGAYGGGLAYGEGALVFHSYRDPRLAETLVDFAQARTWLETANLTPVMLQEAILARFGQISQPDAPMDLAFKSWERTMVGVSDADRQRMREALAGVTLEQVKEVASRWLDPNLPSARTAFIGPARVEEAQSLGLDIQTLRSLLGSEPGKTPKP